MKSRAHTHTAARVRPTHADGDPAGRAPHRRFHHPPRNLAPHPRQVQLTTPLAADPLLPPPPPPVRSGVWRALLSPHLPSPSAHSYCPRLPPLTSLTCTTSAPTHTSTRAHTHTNTPLRSRARGGLRAPTAGLAQAGPARHTARAWARHTARAWAREPHPHTMRRPHHWPHIQRGEAFCVLYSTPAAHTGPRWANILLPPPVAAAGRLNAGGSGNGGRRMRQ